MKFQLKFLIILKLLDHNTFLPSFLPANQCKGQFFKILIQSKKVLKIQLSFLSNFVKNGEVSKNYKTYKIKAFLGVQGGVVNWGGFHKLFCTLHRSFLH